MANSADHTILVVDDEEMALEATAELLTREGYKVLVTDHGHKAVTLCREQEIQLMILDYMMPELSGEDVVRTVRSFDPDLQIVLQTGYNKIPPRELLHRLDIQGYHSKIDGPEKLLLWVDIALNSYEHLRACRTLEHSLLVMGLALEARNLETAGHTQRVVQLAEQVGRKLGLSGRRLEALRQGAYLHDLGKLCVPDAILLKPEALRPEEWLLMKSHAQQGFALAAHIPGVAQEALNVIQYHHEQWDGSGYPAGLAGEAIPLLARIFMVCDVYDALTSIRPHKEAWTHAQACEELYDQRGRQFDPAVVEAFLALDHVEEPVQHRGEVSPTRHNLIARTRSEVGHRIWQP